MYRRVWNWILLSRIITMTDGRAKSSADVDNALVDYDARPLEISQLVKFGMQTFDVPLPDNDAHMIAAARQYGGKCRTEAPRIPGTVLLMANGKLALALDRTRTIESYGMASCIVAAPAVGRYLEAWEIPGVIYMGGQ